MSRSIYFRPPKKTTQALKIALKQNLDPLRFSRQRSYFVKQKNQTVNNARSKLSKLKVELDFVGEVQKGLEKDTKSIRLGIQFLKEDLGKNLKQVQKSLVDKIKELDKKVHIKVRSDKLKFDCLQNMSDGLTKNQKEIKDQLSVIEEKVAILENAMGNGMQIVTFI